MSRRVPIVSTAIVLIAAGIMIALGVWQLHRKTWKEGLIARYEHAQEASAEVPWPSGPGELETALFHRSRVDCAVVTGMGAVAGRSAQGASGWSHLAECRLAGGGTAEVALGWSNAPAPPRWSGGPVSGWVTSGSNGARLIASPPQAGLAQLARPDPRDLPNNHLSYAVQWFLFAATALVIYALALAKRRRPDRAG